MSTHTAFLRRAIAATVAGCVSASALAGGPLNLNANDPEGVERWPNGGQDIPYNIDLGDLGPLSNAEGVALVEGALAAWQGIPSATATYSTTGQLPFDVDATNFAPFVNNLFFGTNDADGLSPVVFDADGSIFVALFGVSGVLGFASTDTRDADGNPIEAVNFLNGGAILGGFPEADFAGVTFHEFGHYSGMGHTVVNGQNIALGDTSGPSPNNTYGDSPADQTETMYPFALVGGGQVTPHADDIAYYSFMYPTDTFFAESGTITGQIQTPSGDGITGVNVIARNVDNPFVDAVSAISGDREGNGIYTINGLTPGESYTIHVDQILDGGFSTTPVALPGPEEFYNAGESNNITSPDDPAEATPVTVAAGAPVEGIDILFNQPGPGDDLNLGDDDFVQVFPSFEIGFCGQRYDSLFINSNGSVTFGAGSTDFSESVGDHLLGPPRIAGVWDDLSPNQGGTVTFIESADKFSVIFTDVPEFLAGNANSFSIVIQKTTAQKRGEDTTGKLLSNPFYVEYGSIDAVDGLAGYSCGGADASGFEAPTDLSSFTRAIKTAGNAAVYELFSTASPNDLAGSRLRYLGTRPFRDRFEPNNSADRAKPVALPFDTIELYSGLDPDGGDVDYYSFFAEGGTTLLAEVITGGIDSVLGLYRITKKPFSAELIGFDDDGGAGTLSRLVVPLEESGYYALAVSSFPDGDFTGAGFTTGRYVVTADTVDGTLISLGDDDSLEVPLEFSFPFNGASYDSVWINSNGNLTFGGGDTDFSESVSELLGELPRIAPLWDDLSPNAGGLVLFNSDASSFTVEFRDVPEFFATTGNTFSVTLDASGGIKVIYGTISATDGIAGVTEGNGAADPGSSDLSASPVNPATGTTYESFGFGNPNDLTDAVLDFVDP